MGIYIEMCAHTPAGLSMKRTAPPRAPGSRASHDDHLVFISGDNPR